MSEELNEQNEQIEHLKGLKRTHTRVIRELEKQQAVTPNPSNILQIQDREQEIKNIDRQINNIRDRFIASKMTELAAFESMKDNVISSTHASKWIFLTVLQSYDPEIRSMSLNDAVLADIILAVSAMCDMRINRLTNELSMIRKMWDIS